MELERIHKLVHWSFGFVAVVILISGFGITEYKIVEAITLGFLTKTLSFQLHSTLAWIFAALFVLHIYFTVIRKKPAKTKKNQN